MQLSNDRNINHKNIDSLIAPSTALRAIWQMAELDAEALSFLTLTGSEPMLPSSFAVGTAAQVTIAAAALASAEVRFLRGAGRQAISVDMRHAAHECGNFFKIDGVQPKMWDKLSGLYPCGQGANAGWVRIHANFAHHRDGALHILGLPIGGTTERVDVINALTQWSPKAFENAATERGLVVAALRTFEEWDGTAQGQAIARMPLLTIEKIGTASPKALPILASDARPLTGIRVLDLTRILAGPAATRALAAYGAEVLLVNSPNLPNIGNIPSTARGKLSTHLDLLKSEGRESLLRLAEQSHVFVQGYRPGGLEKLGFGPQALAELNPGIVYVSLSAYGDNGPWANHKGFDSLVQTATGFNAAEAMAAGSEKPKEMPIQILDYAAGYLMAFGAQVALMRQLSEGGSWHVKVSLAQAGHWLRSLGRQPKGLLAETPAEEDLLELTDSGFGKLLTIKHSAQFSQTPASWRYPSVPLGTHAPVWPT